MCLVTGEPSPRPSPQPRATHRPTYMHDTRMKGYNHQTYKEKTSGKKSAVCLEVVLKGTVT